MDASVFHHFPLPYPHLYHLAANRNGFSRFSPNLPQSSLKEIKAAGQSHDQKPDAIKAHVGEV